MDEKVEQIAKLLADAIARKWVHDRQRRLADRIPDESAASGTDGVGVGVGVGVGDSNYN